jgi:hypothetical protein
VELKAGTRLASAVCSTEVIVIRPPAGPVTVTCGGHPMVPAGDPAAAGDGAIEPGHDAGTQLGKRYWDETASVELLCTKAGKGSLAVDGRLLEVKQAKPLPSSD